MSGSSQITNDTVDSLFGTLSQEEGIATPQSTTTALATPGRPSFMTGALPLVVIPAVKSTTQPAKDESPRKAAFPEAEKSVYGSPYLQFVNSLYSKLIPSRFHPSKKIGKLILVLQFMFSLSGNLFRCRAYCNSSALYSLPRFSLHPIC